VLDPERVLGIVIALVFISGVILVRSAKVIGEQERGIQYRFGRFMRVLPPGLHWTLPFTDDVERMDLREVAKRIEDKTARAERGEPLSYVADLRYRIVDADRACLIRDAHGASVQAAEEAMRAALAETPAAEAAPGADGVGRRARQIAQARMQEHGVEITSLEVRRITHE
jgi:regulator of protease activity HflC (stomatin/prohibitin superfamily)